MEDKMIEYCGWRFGGCVKGKADKNKNGIVETDELRAFVSQEVPRLCKRVKFSVDEYQHPTVDRDNIYQKYGFPVVR